MQLRGRTFLFFMTIMFITFSYGSSSFSMERDEEHFPEEIAKKIRASLIQDALVMMPTEEEKAPILRELYDVKSRISEYWKTIKNDVLRGGTETSWLLALKEYGIINERDVEAVRDRYASFCAKQKEENNFLSQIGSSRDFPPSDQPFKSPAFLVSLLGKDSDLTEDDTSDMYFPLVVQEWLEFQYFKSIYMKKSIKDVSKMLSEEDEIEKLFEDAYLIYWKGCMMDTSKASEGNGKISLSMEGFSPELKEKLANPSTYATKKMGRKDFLRKCDRLLNMCEFLKECRQKSYGFGFVQQGYFFEELESIVGSKMGPLERVVEYFEEELKSKKRGVLRQTAFNKMVGEMQESLKSLKVLFEEKKNPSSEGQPAETSRSFSVGAYEEILRHEISFFSPEDIELYQSSIQKFYTAGWNVVQSDLEDDLSGSMEKCGLIFQVERIETEKKKLKDQIQSLEKGKDVLEATLKDAAEKETKLKEQISTLREKVNQKSMRDASNVSSQEKSSSENDEKARLDSSLHDAQSQLKLLRSELKTLKEQSNVSEKKIELKVDQEITKRVQLQKKEFQSEKDKLTQRHTTERDQLTKQIEILQAEIAKENLQKLAFFKACFDLVQNDSLLIGSWDALKETIRHLKVYNDKLLSEKKALAFDVKSSQENARKSQISGKEAQDEHEQALKKWREEKEQMQDDFQRQISALGIKIKEAEARATEETAKTLRSQAYARDISAGYLQRISGLEFRIAQLMSPQHPQFATISPMIRAPSGPVIVPAPGASFYLQQGPFVFQ